VSKKIREGTKQGLVVIFFVIYIVVKIFCKIYKVLFSLPKTKVEKIKTTFGSTNRVARVKGKSEVLK